MSNGGERKVVGVTYLTSVINEQLFNIFLRDFAEMEIDNEVCEIHIKICSPGGDMSYGLAIFDEIKLMPKPVTVIIQGMTASAAALISQAGAKRLITPNGEIVLHRPFITLSEGTNVDSKEAERLLKRTKELEKRMFRILSGSTGKKIKQLKEDIGDEVRIFSAKDALSYGLVDKII